MHQEQKSHPECQENEFFVGNEPVWYDIEYIPNSSGDYIKRYVPRLGPKKVPNFGDRFGKVAYNIDGKKINETLPVFKKKES